MIINWNCVVLLSNLKYHVSILRNYVPASQEGSKGNVSKIRTSDYAILVIVLFIFQTITFMLDSPEPNRIIPCTFSSLCILSCGPLGIFLSSPENTVCASFLFMNDPFYFYGNHCFFLSSSWSGILGKNQLLKGCCFLFTSVLFVYCRCKFLTFYEILLQVFEPLYFLYISDSLMRFLLWLFSWPRNGHVSVASMFFHFERFCSLS